ncbi:MAG: hypothetical protein IJN87_01290 [Firmicutes bacterium]|nr:hypothetical protein [Bacillota bacterium]
MKSYYYNICDLNIRLTAEHELTLGDDSTQFVSSSKNMDAEVNLEAVSELTQPVGTLCNSSDEFPVYRNGNLITRGTWDLFKPHPHVYTNYDLLKPEVRSCMIREEYWDWATRGKYLWSGLSLHTLLLNFKAMMFHASYIDHEGKGIVFTAPSGTGKSTQASLWKKYRGAKVLNGDKVGIRMQDTPMVHGVPFSGTSGICENVSLPLKAMVVLSQAPINSVVQLTPTQAIKALFPNLFVDRSINEEWQLALRNILDLVTAVPVFALACTPDEQAVETLAAAFNHI